MEMKMEIDGVGDVDGKMRIKIDERDGDDGDKWR